MVSCRFSLKPIHIAIKTSPKEEPSIFRSSECPAAGRQRPSAQWAPGCPPSPAEDLLTLPVPLRKTSKNPVAWSKKLLELQWEPPRYWILDQASDTMIALRASRSFSRRFAWRKRLRAPNCRGFPIDCYSGKARLQSGMGMVFTTHFRKIWNSIISISLLEFTMVYHIKCNNYWDRLSLKVGKKELRRGVDFVGSASSPSKKTTA